MGSTPFRVLCAFHVYFLLSLPFLLLTSYYIVTGALLFFVIIFKIFSLIPRLCLWGVI